MNSVLARQIDCKVNIDLANSFSRKKTFTNLGTHVEGAAEEFFECLNEYLVSKHDLIGNIYFAK